MAVMTFIPSREQIDAVHDWRACSAERRQDRPIVPLLRERFAVTALQAIAIIRAAGRPGETGGLESKRPKDSAS